MAGQVKIKVNPLHIEGTAQKGLTVFQAARNHNIFLRSDCGEKGTCGKCRVIAEPSGNLGPKTKTEEKLLSASQLESSQRLACQAKICGPVTITIPTDLMVTDDVYGKTGVNGSFPVNPDRKKTKKTCTGFAFDIGTTTIAAYLCDLASGRVLTAKAMVNPQRQFGEDVISRIAAIGVDEKNLKLQQTLVAAAMNDLINTCLKTTGHGKADVDDITVVGNTTMEHILSGLNPKSLGVSPYLPVTRSSIQTWAPELGLDLLPETPVYIFPVISGFLGGDILSALLADRSWEKEETTLIIDIGTNGELMLSCPNGLWATSCATGPALEGAQISCGMRAAPGAISKVFFNPEAENQILLETIENKKPIGICGSGIIDALAAMRKACVTLENGTFNTEKPGVFCDEKGMGRKFLLPKSNIYITLKDVRQVQLAKAALFVGIEALLQKAGITTVDRTLLTGAFGAKFIWQNARDIGMLPHGICKGKIKSAQNLAGTGAIIALLDKDRRTEIEAIARKINFLDLSCEPDFTAKFSNATQFPALK
ncbi:MAG: DUF4445 domain-containing protein [Proteobacteria bacterium]|nr:DUF4445 domain-containing protein [Pseudomonadota bacterium]MBU1581521.1 DUF4445 domain-containing protein [Pseudomonadota bacterium]MBU2628067.1 DUF4445 domain-containing protein [Pseudomonadota bacterium]